SILFISINCFGELPGWPSVPDMCVKCHGLDIYDEWHDSAHGGDWEVGDTNIITDANATCFDCHIPGGAQNEEILDGDKKGFHILGCYDCYGREGWVRLKDPDDVCLRCHTGHSPCTCIDKHGKPCEGACIKCHMPVDGLKTYRVHEGKPIYLDKHGKDGMDNNIAKYVTREHRNHKFPKEMDKKR
ncbi:MAG: hypothetical protein KAV69_03400, partial [Deltaproteobacteria bacterium]|nr:hypothetical protein [Deltaproteobacteria bacterium]